MSYLTTKQNQEKAFKTTLEFNLFSKDKSNEFQKEYGSSFFILNVNKLKEKTTKKFILHLRVHMIILSLLIRIKQIYLPYLCKELSRCGAYSEVVSRLEYDLAIKIGIDPTKVIFNGPLKSQEDIHYALNNEK